MTTPAAYLRKSKDAATKKDHLDLLMASVHAAGHNGDTVVYDDWAKSGDVEKLSKRTEWKRLCDAIERGEHDVVFMNSLDRGGRSIEEWLRFIRLARSRNVRVIADGVDYAAAENRDRLIFESWAAEKELERAKERSARTKRIRAARGDATVGGHAAPYGYQWARAGDVGAVTAAHPDPKRVVVVPNHAEPLEPVLEAVKATGGNVLQATKLLNERGVPSRGDKGWEPRTVARIVDRERGTRRLRGERPTKYRTGVTAAPLSRIVQCHCGSLMTPVRDRRTDQWASLYCSRGHKAGVASHGRYVARSRHVIDRLKAELTGREVKRRHTVSTAPEDVAAKRAGLEEDLRKLGRAYRAGSMTDDEFDSEAAAINDRLADLDGYGDEAISFGVSFSGSVVNWKADDAEVGEAIRRAVRVVRLDESMMPVAVERRA